MSASRITLNIDRLVLRGMDASTAQSFVAGLRQQLARSLAEPATRATLASQHTPLLNLGPLQMKEGVAGAQQLGAGVAQAILRGGRR